MKAKAIGRRAALGTLAAGLAAPLLDGCAPKPSANQKKAQMEIRNAAWQYGPISTMRSSTAPAASSAWGDAGKASNLIATFLYEDSEEQAAYAAEGEPAGLFFREGQAPASGTDLTHPDKVARDMAALRPKLVAHRSRIAGKMTALKAAVDGLNLDPKFKAYALRVALAGNGGPRPILIMLWDCQLETVDGFASIAQRLLAIRSQWRLEDGKIMFLRRTKATEAVSQAMLELDSKANAGSALRRDWEAQVIATFRAWDAQLAYAASAEGS